MAGKFRMTEKEAIARGIIPPPDENAAIPPLRDWVLENQAQAATPKQSAPRVGLDAFWVVLLMILGWLVGFACGLKL